MKPETRQRIYDAYDSLNDDEINTVALLQMTADTAGVTYSNVVDALHYRSKQDETTQRGG